jgi:hypothetical protein
MLCDYASGKITSDRKKEIDEFLKTDETCRADLEKLMLAMDYCVHLRQIQTPDAWVERWRNLPPALARRISDWEMKLVSNLWTALPYCVSLAVVVFGIVIFKPWKLIYSREAVVWSAADLTLSPPKTMTAESVSVVSLPSSTPTPTPSVEVAPKEKPKVVAAVETPKEIFYGDAYDAALDVDDFEKNTILVKQNILNFKGTKAGKTSLGSHRGEDESVFDFTLPESNLEAFTDFLATLGPVRISKQNQQVAVSEGKIRIILILKENADHDAEAPPP